MTEYITPLPAPGAALSWPRSVVLLGSTGSIGVSALTFMAGQRDSFRVAALAGARNIARLAAQADTWRPPYLAVLDEAGRDELRALLPAGYSPEILCGPEGYAALAMLPEADIVLSAQVGAAGLTATEAAARAGKTIALANKESLVLAGELLRDTCRASGAVILPVDSEHNAIFQCLAGQNDADVARIILTASGGPFRGKDAAFLKTVTPEMALAHPNWSMGAKISIDSATMINKGLEVIEAHYLYGLPVESIAVLIHPQSLVHSLVEFSDGSLLAQAGTPDMRTAIAYALAWPRRMETGVPRLNLAQAAALTFEEPDFSVFPGLSLAIQALQEGRGLPIVYNAANEVAVSRFLNREIPFNA
ncbi:1-deoxy-D-xylulose-5-phosphate reductoisomerase, partial [Desulfovibrio sp. OttesenSCG-928-I05]|nr:1-deoxy-D-xylulose-5-phosphate reductoisomerase [Desulfovibrio sp. OttesenSCG-928-I05]